MEYLAGLAHLYVYGMIRVCTCVPVQCAMQILLTYNLFPVHDFKDPVYAEYESSTQSPPLSYQEQVHNLKLSLQKISITAQELRGLVSGCWYRHHPL